MRTNSKGKQVCVVIGATSKWQSDGRNTVLAHGHPIDDSDVPVGIRWGVGGAVAQKFAQEGFFTVLTTRNEANAAPLAAAIREQGGECMIFELAARQEADDGPVAVLSAGDDAHAGAGADRGVLRARRPRRQHRHRRLDRLARQPRPAAKPEPPRSGAQPHQDRRGVLLSPHPGQVVLDARAAADAVWLKTELLTLEAVSALTDGSRPSERGVYRFGAG